MLTCLTENRQVFTNAAPEKTMSWRYILTNMVLILDFLLIRIKVHLENRFPVIHIRVHTENKTARQLELLHLYNAFGQ
ncbi:hypothetical protein HAX54_013725 [Datura stramonium]|uniref:Uncharacterized protein n=1 Tax=Datura stramonium TaxID=4076 RepID=A0ABS8TMQ7_DATST|nr:hypothetical protein [Datura stramonium]